MVILLPLFLGVYFDTLSAQNSRSIGRWWVDGGSRFRLVDFLAQKYPSGRQEKVDTMWSGTSCQRSPPISEHESSDRRIGCPR